MALTPDVDKGTTGYVVKEGDIVLAKGLTLEQAVKLRDVNPYVRRVEWRP